MPLRLFYFFLALSDFLSQTSAISVPSRIMIRQEDSLEISIGLDDPTLFYSSPLLAANDLGSSHKPLGPTDSDANNYDFDRPSVDDGEVSMGSPPNSLIPQYGDLLAFHDGDLPPEGWGDCEFPKMPACCEHGWLNIFCVWYHASSYVCPEHPQDYPFPRGPNEQAKYRAVCCDQVKEGVGIGCVPVTGREEKEGLDIEYPPDGDWLDDWPEDHLFPGGQRQFNNLQFNPVPGTCKSTYRRDEEFEEFCPLPE